MSVGTAHQLFKVTPLGISNSQSTLPASGQRLPDGVNGKWGQFYLHLLAPLRLSPTEGSEQVPLTLCPTLALNSHLKPRLASNSVHGWCPHSPRPSHAPGTVRITYPPPSIWSLGGLGALAFLHHLGSPEI